MGGENMTHPTKYFSHVTEKDLKSIDHICKVMLNRRAKELTEQEKFSLVNEYYSWIELRNRGLIRLPVT